MHFGNERAGRIDISKAAALRLGRDRLGDSMSGKYDRTVVRNFVELVDEHGADRLQPIHHEAIMDDLVAHIDRRSEPLERQLDDLDRAIHAGAEASRRGDEDMQGRSVQHPDRACKPSLAAVEGGSYERAHSIS